MGADLIVQHIAVKPGSVDDGFGLQRAPAAGQQEMAALTTDFVHAGVEKKFHTVLSGIFGKGDGHAEGTDDGAGGRVQSGCHLPGEGGLQLVNLLCGEDTQTLYAVFLPAAEKLLQTGNVFAVKAQYQRAVAAIRKIQLAGQVLHHAAAGYIEFRFQGAGLGVKAGMNNGGICLAGAGTDIFLPFAQGHLQLPAAQLPGGGTAHGSAADDNGVIDHRNTPLHAVICKKATQTKAQISLHHGCMTQTLLHTICIFYNHTPNGRGVSRGEKLWLRDILT